MSDFPILDRENCQGGYHVDSSAARAAESNDGHQVVTAGETAQDSPETATQLDGGAIAAVKGQSRLANVNDVEPLPSNQISQWNFDMSAAPRGEIVLQTRKGANGPVEVPVYKHVRLIALGSAGVVTLSRWLPDEKRWEMFTKDVPPIAWQPWPTAPVVPT